MDEGESQPPKSLSKKYFVMNKSVASWKDGSRMSHDMTSDAHVSIPRNNKRHIHSRKCF